jgi:uncharacterized protein (UPF0371 family)
MGVNMAGFCIDDDEAVCHASKYEIVRRYYDALCSKRNGLMGDDEIFRAELLMNRVGIDENYRKVIKAAMDKAEETDEPAAAIELNDGRIVTGKTGKLLGASAAALLNALKVLAGIDDEIDIISSSVIEPIQKLKVNHMGSLNPRLHTDEILICLAVCAVTNPIAQRAMDQLSKLKGAQLHSTVILSHVDNKTLKRLGIDVTCEPRRN